MVDTATFIKKAAELAKKHQSNIFPSVTIAQSILESGWGESTLAKKYNNYFGIKSIDGDESVQLQTFEDDGTGTYYTIKDGFKVYDSPEGSFADHDAFFVNTDFRKKNYAPVVTATTPEEQATQLQKCGYATDTKYPSKLINLINTYNLKQYDTGGSETMAVTAEQIVKRALDNLGVQMGDKYHKQIVDMYNNVSPKPVGYTAKTIDDWCDIFVTWVFDMEKASSLIGRECGVQRHKAILQTKGIWKGRVKPQAGDIVIFDWQGHNKGWADHIGLVEKVVGNIVHTIEGNSGSPSQVRRQQYAYDDNRIVGYARPKYGASTTTTNAGSTNPTSTTYKVTAGDTLSTIATKYAVSVNDLVSWNNIQNRNIIKVGQVLVVKKEDVKVPSGKELQKYVGNGGAWKDMKVGDKVTIRKGATKWLNGNLKQMEPMQKDFTGQTDEITKVVDVKIGYSDKAYWLKRLGVGILEQDLVEPRGETVIEQVEDQPIGGDEPVITDDTFVIDGVKYKISKA